MVKVVITGVSGLLGSTMAKYLVAKGNYEIVGIDNMIGALNGNVPEVAEYIRGEYSRHSFDDRIMRRCRLCFSYCCITHEGFYKLFHQLVL